MRIRDAQLDFENYPDHLAPFDPAGIETVVTACRDMGSLYLLAEDLKNPHRVKHTLEHIFQVTAGLKRILQQAAQAIADQVKSVLGAVTATVQNVVNALNSLFAWVP